MRCPICGSLNIELRTHMIEGDEKQQVRTVLNEDSTIDYFYKGSKWFFEKSIGVLTASHGLTYRFGNEIAKMVTQQFDDYIERHKEHTLDQIPDLLLIEIKCTDCKYIIK